MSPTFATLWNPRFPVFVNIRIVVMGNRTVGWEALGSGRYYCPSLAISTRGHTALLSRHPRLQIAWVLSHTSSLERELRIPQKRRRKSLIKMCRPSVHLRNWSAIQLRIHTVICARTKVARSRVTLNIWWRSQYISSISEFWGSSWAHREEGWR